MFQFLDASELVIPTRSNTGVDYIHKGKLHNVILQSMLIEQSNWHQALIALEPLPQINDDPQVVCFGPERCLPPLLARKLGPRFLQVTNFDVTSQNVPLDLLGSNALLNRIEDSSDTAIAVIGMSCQAPGASDPEEFWELLRTGESQHIEVPSHRFGMETAWRDIDPTKKWFGNFIEDYDAFDHKFFKKSPREMESTDPQHRLMLQVAYQAVQQSGYFSSFTRNNRIGCYIGMGTVDYENNIAGYPANAYSATGNLRAFAAGKISHYFGWTGPGLTVDTACSSSAVAIHLACRAILGGECDAALAGGVNVLTSPEWFQNLAGASFLSPTGQSKPFDAKADGYCRGEAVGAVYLEKLSTAITKGNQIFGIIKGSAVTQNQNCTPITVPNAVSLADLFSNATRQAGLEPRQVSVVEAHGTGTPVGDPAEYDGICRVFGGQTRSDILSLGSVKGLLGHTEYASGIIALLKILLMIHEEAIPPQPSFQNINPSIHASPTDNIEITTCLETWKADFRAALINNYGASGSNATMVVTEASGSKQRAMPNTTHPNLEKKQPFAFFGHDESALRRYAAKFIQFLQRKRHSAKHTSITNLAFQVSRQSNQSLTHHLIFTCSSANELQGMLSEFLHGNQSVASKARKSARPIVLCFGGQISTFVGLDRQVYEGVKILRSYLDQCNVVCQSLGLESFYPSIFQRSPIKDVVRLQTMLFAIQYSCARSWIDCGLRVAAIVGHSFGELTGLCVSGNLSLSDTLRMIVLRARLIEGSWGSDKGSMMAVEAGLEDVEKLLDLSNKAFQGEPAVSIACFNGPKSFTLAGPTATINWASQIVANDVTFSSIKSKKLNVTNAFHSTLVEPLLVELEQLGQGLTFQKPSIPFERAVEFGSENDLTGRYLADHMRNPVYFSHALQRLSQQYPSCVFLEAGSNSTVTTMASRALGSRTSCHFQSINITSESSLQHLADATANIWKEGISTLFWPHHFSQAPEYTPLLLPPYQFEKFKHWMELKKPQKGDISTLDQSQVVEAPEELWTFSGFQDRDRHSVRFRINTSSQHFRDYVSGYVISQSNSLCSSTLLLHIAVDAIASLRQQSGSLGFQPQLQGINSHAPLFVQPLVSVWLDAETTKNDSQAWDWRIYGNSSQNGSAAVLHMSGQVLFQPDSDPKLQGELATYRRLVDRQRCLHLLDSYDVDEVIQGRSIYKAYAETIEYGELFRGVQKIVSKSNESAGRIQRLDNGETWLDIGLADSLCQIAGIFINTMTERPAGDTYLLNKVDRWIRSPASNAERPRLESWDCYARHYRSSDAEFISDIFVFNQGTGVLQEVILGIHHLKISKDEPFIERLEVDSHANTPKLARLLSPSPSEISKSFEHSAPSKSTIAAAPPEEKKQKQSSRQDVSVTIKDLLSNLSGLEPHEINDNSDLVDLGIDSLMGMELAREVEFAFKCSLNTSDLIELTDFDSLVKCVKRTLGISDLDEHVVVDGGNGNEETLETAQQQNDIPHDIDGDSPCNNSVSYFVSGNSCSASDDFSLLPKTILDAFAESKQATDNFINEFKLANYVHQVLPRSTELCVAYIVEAFEKLGCSLRDAKPGQKLNHVQYLPKHKQFMEWIYDFLEKHARLIDSDGSQIWRTALPMPNKPAEALLQDILRSYPSHACDHQLTQLTSVKLAECLIGEADGLKLVFGSAEGREIASAMYSESPINLVWIKQIEDFLKRLLSRCPTHKGPVNVLEMGSGTGGTTAKLVPLLATLGVPVQYTVTDISSSLVGAARKRFKQYPFMQFKVLDIEKRPPADLLHSQHIVLATNCVHATHSLVNSTTNIHNLLRSDGLLMMLEMTEQLPWIDIVFGLLEGWWLFKDGRRHALAPASVWERTLHSVGYGHVDWTEGNLPEASIQRVIIALASSPRYERAAIPREPEISPLANREARQAAIDFYVDKYIDPLSIPLKTERSNKIKPPGHCIVITGATGSLGSHIVAHLVSQPEVTTVVCLNRPSAMEAIQRQRHALKSRDISLGTDIFSKIKVFAVDTSKPMLDLPQQEYDFLVTNMTHIVNNAWPMSITRPVSAFEPQFKTMQNLVGLARQSSCERHEGSKIGFQLISSIAAVANYPLVSGKASVPEEGVAMEAVPSTGYAEAKLVCESILKKTLGQDPERFRPMVVRIGQIAGSTTSGYWNPIEHPAFIVKSSQTLRALPDLRGVCARFFSPADPIFLSLSMLLAC